MIPVDSSIWIDHLRRSNAAFTSLLDQDLVLVHPFVIGELAMGGLANPRDRLFYLREFAHTLVADDDEVLGFIAKYELFGIGIGYIDAHLLASTQLTPETTLWTRDKRLNEVAVRLSLAFKPQPQTTPNPQLS